MDNDQKFDVIMKDIGEIRIVQAEQHIILKEHIRRTELLEEDIKPVKKHVNMVEGVLKFIGLLGIFAGIGELIILYLKH